MKKFFACMMGLTLLISPQFLVSAFAAIPIKNNHFNYKTPPPNMSNVNYSPKNLVVTWLFGQIIYGNEQDFAVTIKTTGKMWNYLEEKLGRLSSISISDAKAFYKKFFGDDDFGLDSYNKRWQEIKNDIETKLNKQGEKIDVGINFNEILRQYIESPDGWNNFYNVFTGNNPNHNIYPNEKTTPEEREEEYRREGLIFQFVFAKIEYNGRYVWFIPSYNVRVFPNTWIVNHSSILRYFKNGKKTINNHIVASWGTVVVLVPSPEPQEVELRGFTKKILDSYADDKFKLTSIHIRQRDLLEWNDECKAWDDKYRHPKFYKCEGERRDPFQRPTEPNFLFQIKNPDPDDENKHYTVLLLIVLAVSSSKKDTAALNITTKHK